MQNIEIKTPLADRAAVERRLEAMGARRMWCRRQRDTYFQVPRGMLKLREVEGARPEIISYERSADGSGPAHASAPSRWRRSRDPSSAASAQCSPIPRTFSWW